MTSVDETVYNLLNQAPRCLPPLPTQTKYRNLFKVDEHSWMCSRCAYRSIFASDVSRDYRARKDSHRTMGLAAIPKPDPCRPLRRRQNDVPLPEGNDLRSVRIAMSGPNGSYSIHSTAPHAVYSEAGQIELVHTKGVKELHR